MHPLEARSTRHPRERRAPSANRVLPWFAIVVSFALLVMVAACASDVSSQATERATSTTVATLASATALAGKDARLASALAKRAPGAGWVADGDGFTSPGWRSRGSSGALHARLARGADAAVEVGPGSAPSLHLQLTARAASPVQGGAVDGHVVYKDAFGPGEDLVATATDDAMEELFLLRDAQAAHDFAWDVALPSGVARGALRSDGSVRFDDANGKLVVHVPPPYAVDAAGVKRNAKLGWDAETKRLDVHLDTAGLVFPVLLDPAFEVAVWEQVQAPPARSNDAMAYDAARGRVVLFGGEDSLGNYLSDTWTWDGTVWTQASPATSPTGREGQAMAYDAARGRVVLFGGYDGFGELADTWTWDGKTWSQASPATSPSSVSDHSMAYDAARGQIVLLTRDASVELADTWTWDGTTWTHVSTAKSPPFGLLAFDEAHGLVVLFEQLGGANATWTWDGTTWTQESPAMFPPAFPYPPNGSYSVMAYDAARAVEVLFGDFEGLAVTWTWDGKTWTQASPATSPPPLLSTAMAYDAAHARMVLFGGYDGTSVYSANTWTWDGTTWTQASALNLPPAREDSALAFDAAHGQVVLFGGEGQSVFDLADTWTWGGTTWTEVLPATSPPGRLQHAMAYDAARGQVVLFGGRSTSALADTWTWNGQTWMQSLPATSPPARSEHAMAYDAIRSRVLLFGGESASGMQLGDTWTWDGTNWMQAFPVTSPPARFSPAMAFDAARGLVVLFGGGNSSSGELADTWTWDGTTWAPVSPATSPPSRAQHAMAYDTTRARVVMFGGENPRGTLEDTWIWDGATWSEASAATSPPARSGNAMAYDPMRDRVVLFGGFGGKLFADTWLYYARGGTCATGADCGSGFCVDAVCCDAPSCGTCQACNLASSPGTCGFVTSAPDPDSCAGAESCDATGLCKPGLGQMCTTANGGTDCASGNCVDGVCCNTACGDSCQSCSAALTGKANGTCAPTKSGVDPNDDCADDGATTCARDGTCDGTGRCRIYALGTACGPAECEQNRATGQICNGLGACGASASGVECTPYVCNVETGGCFSTCASSAQCLTEDICTAGTCHPRVQGASCDGHHTVTAPDGTATDCSPYTCTGSTCNSTCDAITGCTGGTVCNAEHACVTPVQTTFASGCAAAPTEGGAGSSSGTEAVVALGGLASLVALRRKRRKAGRAATIPNPAG